MRTIYKIAGLLFVAVFLLSVVAIMQTAPIAASPPAAQPTQIPTTVPYDIQAPGANAVDINNGGIFRSGVGIVGDANEPQLSIVANSTQTANVVNVENTSGTALFRVGPSGDVTFGADLVGSAQTGLTITQDSAITCLGMNCPISAAGALSTGTVTVPAAGTLLIIRNTGSNTITISDTGTTMLSGDIALGQYDTLTLLSDGTNVIQVATSNN